MCERLFPFQHFMIGNKGNASQARRVIVWSGVTSKFLREESNVLTPVEGSKIKKQAFDKRSTSGLQRNFFLEGASLPTCKLVVMTVTSWAQ